MANIARYKNGHLFSMDGSRTPLMKQIAVVLGAMNEVDFSNLDLFIGRIKQLCEVSHERNCKLYVDAE